jgi:hypothetical protein
MASDDVRDVTGLWCEDLRVRSNMALRLALMCAGLLLAVEAGTVLAQAPSAATSKIARVLPAAAAERVLSRIEDARARGLPAGTLQQRALELSAKGVAPDRIARAIDEQTERLDSAQRILTAGGRGNAAGEEIDAAATALQKGLAGAAVGNLALEAAPGRSLAVPLLVIASLIDRGLPADTALRQVLARLDARVSDQQLAGLASPQLLNGGQARALAGQPFVASKRPLAPGRPACVSCGAVTTGSPATPVRPPGKNRPSPVVTPL